MKHSLYLLIFLLVTPSLTYPASRDFAASTYNFRRASGADLVHILRLIEAFDTDDCRRLLVPPARDRAALLAAEIDLGRMFVVADSAEESNPIIGFCKMYVVPLEELIEIVRSELCALPEAEIFDFSITNDPVQALEFHLSREAVDSFAAPLVAAQGATAYTFRPTEDIYIYLGTNYIKPSHRGRYLDTVLERTALGILYEKTLSPVLRGEGSLYYIYGVVEENARSQGRLRSFADLALRIGGDAAASAGVKISFHAFRAFKPEIALSRGLASPGSPVAAPTSPRKLVRKPTPELLRVASGERLAEAPSEGLIPGLGCFIGFSLDGVGKKGAD